MLFHTANVINVVSVAVCLWDALRSGWLTASAKQFSDAGYDGAVAENIIRSLGRWMC